MFRELGLMEEWGSGYHRVVAACREGGYPEPEWHERGPTLCVTFRPVASSQVPEEGDDPVNGSVDDPVKILGGGPVNGSVTGSVGDPVNDPVNGPVNDREKNDGAMTLNKRQQWFLTELAQGKRISAATLMKRRRVSEKTAKRDIADLKALDLIEFIGAPKTGRYRVKQPDRSERA